MELFNIINILAIFQLLILAIILLKNQNPETPSNKFFGIFLIVNVLLISASLFYNLGELTGNVGSIIIVASLAIFFLLGPLFYYFFRSIFNKDITLTKLSLLHLIPFLLFSIFSIFILSRSFSYAAEGKSDTLLLSFWEYTFYCISVYLQLLIYIIVSYKTTRDYKTNLSNTTLSIDSRSYSWLNFLILIYFFHWLFDSLNAFFHLSGIVPANLNIHFATLSIGMLLVFSTLSVIRGLKGYNVVSIEKEKYRGSTLSLKEKEIVKNKILSSFAEDKLHLNPDITVELLAKKISVHSKSISQVINETFGCNFFDFINSYRINEAKQMIINHNGDSKEKTILEILYSSGFNSKSSFNRAFKKHTGYTPTEFRKVNSAAFPTQDA